MRKTKTIFLLAGSPKYTQKRLIKELKKLGYTVKQPSLEHLNGNDILVIGHSYLEIEDWKEKIKQLNDANYIPLEIIFTRMENSRREERKEAKRMAGSFSRFIEKCNFGIDGMELSKEEYKNTIQKEYETLSKHAGCRDAKRLKVLKSVLLNLKGRTTRYLAMKWEYQYGDLLQRLLIEDDVTDSWCEDMDTALELVEDFLYF